MCGHVGACRPAGLRACGPVGAGLRACGRASLCACGPVWGPVGAPLGGLCGPVRAPLGACGRVFGVPCGRVGPVRACGGLWRPVAACGGLWWPVAACGGLWLLWDSNRGPSAYQLAGLPLDHACVFSTGIANESRHLQMC